MMFGYSESCFVESRSQKHFTCPSLPSKPEKCDAANLSARQATNMNNKSCDFVWVCVFSDHRFDRV